ncbi:D-alanine--poly(phosphoribitol) ligase subunit DltC [Acetanaerobacterium elongatum]|uniref:D-alanyl carrier protein n=1 Tax=Acetanaerobacterium elongatum TaxID=258515 RepID=A0A1G9ZUP8_9FIRM|nr:D-alanine--poly(phosphoribitol) ligase subunit DltC [Acetanaerobacterium elongatum]SDN24671.1 D-alanine--poly(phosphoribitol) ligase subunit 2 [Acetanaerobacterium elongatum]
MDVNSMREEVLAILAQVCGEREILQNDELDLFETGLLDSLALINLLDELEERLNIVIQPSQVKRECWRTPRNIVELVEANR